MAQTKTKGCRGQQYFQVVDYKGALIHYWWEYKSLYEKQHRNFSKKLKPQLVPQFHSQIPTQGWQKTVICKGIYTTMFIHAVL